MRAPDVRTESARLMPHGAGEYRFRWQTATEPVSAGTRQAWEALIAKTDNPYALFQSPAWWDYLSRSQQAANCALCIVENAAAEVVGVVPVRRGACAFPFAIGSRTLYSPRLVAVQPLGNQPLLASDDEQLLAGLVCSLLENFADCAGVEMQCVPVNSPWWRAAFQSQSLAGRAIAYALDANINNYVIQMPATFAGYLQQFKAKTRYNLRRQVRRLREYGGGELELVRVESSPQVQAFLEAAVPLTAADQERYRGRYFRLQNDAVEQEKLHAAAGSGILRSYLLRCGGRVVAYVKGFQQYDTYYYHQIGFDEALAEYSPGIVMMYLLLEDLFAHRAPKRVNLYSGDSAYKQQFGNEREQAGRMVLLRDTVSHRLLTRSHAVLRYFVLKAKNAVTVKSTE